MHVTIGNDPDVKYFLSATYNSQGLFDTEVSTFVLFDSS